jgi:hypothetical protein
VTVSKCQKSDFVSKLLGYFEEEEVAGLVYKDYEMTLAAYAYANRTY